MQIKTPEGIADPAPLSDIQEYNKRLKYHSAVLRFGITVGGVIGCMFLIIIVWLIWYIMANNVLNNIVARCVC